MIGGSYLGGIAECEKFEGDGFFGLSWRSYGPMYTGDLGRGSHDVTARFLTEEGRTYFIQAEKLREKCADLADELAAAQRELQKIKDRREKRRKQRLLRLARI